MRKARRRKYQKPTMQIKKVKVTFFSSRFRADDSLNLLITDRLLAQSGGSGGSCSTSNYP